jgi:hypothetical protein
MRTVEEELELANRYVDYWKSELRLDHFDFEVVIRRPEEESSQGSCKSHPSFHRQKIWIPHPNDRTREDDLRFIRDLEITIVHELLHTKEFVWRKHPKIDKVFEEDEWVTSMHEDYLDAVAEAIVRARRQMRRVEDAE